MKKILFAGSMLTLLASPAFAQDASDEDVIIVLGAGLPETPATPAYSSVTIDRETIAASGSGRIEDVLSSVAGFQQFRRSDSRSSNPSAQGATLRALGGNATSRALMLLDGVPVSDPFFGYIPFTSIAPERLGSVRVTRGGGSGPFGSGALAGTIEMESADADTLGLFSAQALMNQRSESQLSATIAPQLGDGYAVVSGRWDRGKGFFTAPEDQRALISSRAAFDSWSISGRVVQPLGDDLEVQIRALAYEDERTLRFDGADSSTEGQDASVRLISRGPWQVDALAYGQWRNFTNVVISSSRFVRVLDQKDTPAEGQGGKIEIRPPLGDDNVLRFGVDYRRSSGELFEDNYSAFTGARREQRFAGGTNSNLGLFAEHDWTIGALVLTGGVRADRYTIADGFYYSFNDATGETIRDDTYADRSDWEVTWRAGALVQVNEAVRLRAAAYSSLRLPTLNELYRPFVIFPLVTNANPDLDPEKLKGFEIGFDLMPSDDLRFSVTVFDNELQGAIANVTLAENLRERRNLDAIDASGIEFTAHIASGTFSLDSSIAVTSAKVRGSGFAAALDGNRPPQTPKLAASTTASWGFMENGRVAATLRHVGAQFESDQETNVLPAVTTLDLYAQMPVGAGFSVVARAENVFDATIVTRNNNGVLDLGVPATYWLGLKYGF